ncbi:nucleotide-binding universal stress UspA family protein [Paraburkholderia bannensis]|uniref:Nucleotide-binding universal stress UspA family protein n=1 Tax=Paraburkholderia bannensis TaxID=765414 RepID=A0A7W9U4M3_9BURK|nr:MULTISPECIES: universal stress protein [Paraburkholderia]MBB3261918.1 nucleotide-binding universal stress UspA family protein [Paraburkholderia sp. WP4_3_2]MBB6106913.1 nucleotide-binding universal stress UspA family protein [Paraburkholderia bannensis]
MTTTAYRKILLAVDGSGSARRAAREAIALAALAHAHLHVMYVVHKWGLAPYSGYYDPDALGRVLSDEGRQALDEARRLAIGQNVPVAVELGETLGKSDSIALCLQRCAIIREADLVVAGTHGKRGISRAVLGSVAEELLRISPCPVLIVRC